ncbi:Zinc finger protein 830-like [Plakobranchus ocellatus]|uniref:Zinc finger protein 830 n=1 Tax=Plakobranchus ocellatus TaxID=259542 RepID=A0AAV4DAT4_9GAST|nr:Zinc finger protein 830-like [Plakobranchus ocellatus]
MAAPKKKTVSKDDIRRLMKEKTTVARSSTQKVDHPLAKYNSLQQLVCVLCNNVIKNDLLWPAHILSKQHKERALALKAQGPIKLNSVHLPQGKRKVQDSLENRGIHKKIKTETGVLSKSSSLPADFFDGHSKHSKEEVKERAKAALLAGYSSSSSSEEEEDEDESNSDNTKTSTKSDPSIPTSSKSHTSGLPADFFDPGNEPPEIRTDKTEPPQSKKMSEILPEGFFDDPKLDAKVRNVEYKDKEEEEWELFKKTIKEEAQVSEVIMEEEDEQVNIDRNIDEIDDQIQRWQEVENLHVKKEIILKSSKADAVKEEENNEDVDEEELDDFLDWRAKKPVKNK